MIQEFITKFETQRQEVEEKFRAEHPDGYEEIVKIVVETISHDDDDYDSPDPERIHRIDDGDCQGTLIFVVGARGYQPSNYWATKVYYGSCSGCDTLQRIKDYSDEPPTDEQVRQYMHLAINVLQGFKEI